MKRPAVTVSARRRRAIAQIAATLPVLACAPAVLAQRQRRVHVEFWTMSLRPKFTAFVRALVRDYGAANPHVELEWVDVPWDVLQTKLTAAIVARSAPALVQLNVPWAYDYALHGALLPVDELLGRDRDVYTEGAIADVTFGGRVYGFPHYNSVNVLAYNTALFARAGIAAAPATFDEQLAVARTIRAQTGQAGFSPALGKIGGIFLEAGLPLVYDGRAVFDSASHAALIARLADCYRAGGLLKDKLFAEDNYPASIEAYKAGRMAMLVAPPSGLTRVRDDARDVYALTDVAPGPVGASGIAAGGWLFHFAMPRGTSGEVAIEAARFAKFLTNDTNQLEFAKLAGTFPTSRRAGADPYFQRLGAGSGAYEKAMAIGARGMSLVRTLYVAGVPSFERLNKRLQDAVEAAVIGRREPQAALAEAAEFWNVKLARQRARGSA